MTIELAIFVRTQFLMGVAVSVRNIYSYSTIQSSRVTQLMKYLVVVTMIFIPPLTYGLVIIIFNASFNSLFNSRSASKACACRVVLVDSVKVLFRCKVAYLHLA